MITGPNVAKYISPTEMLRFCDICNYLVGLHRNSFIVAL